MRGRKAYFTNGEYIDMVKCITTSDDLANNHVGFMNIQIRGDIKDYSSSVNNYEIKIYE